MRKEGSDEGSSEGSTEGSVEGAAGLTTIFLPSFVIMDTIPGRTRVHMNKKRKEAAETHKQH